jgi:hypothetical protein
MAEGPADTCVCVLFYGADDYCFQLAQRVLNEPLRQLARLNVEFRFGMNAVGDATRQFVEAAAAEHFNGAELFCSAQNIYKYPIMRRMFYEKPLRAPVTMWFDDNSYLNPAVDVQQWYERITKQLSNCSVIGSVYTQGLVGGQADWIRAQPWFNSRPPGPYVKYPVGGWWAAQTAVLQQFDWPVPEIKHYGGDVMLGELCKQQDLLLCHFRDDVLIQTNSSGVESVGARRGFDAPPVGFDYKVKHEN